MRRSLSTQLVHHYQRVKCKLAIGCFSFLYVCSHLLVCVCVCYVCHVFDSTKEKKHVLSIVLLSLLLWFRYSWFSSAIYHSFFLTEMELQLAKDELVGWFQLYVQYLQLTSARSCFLNTRYMRWSYFSRNLMCCTLDQSRKEHTRPQPCGMYCTCTRTMHLQHDPGTTPGKQIALPSVFGVTNLLAHPLAQSVNIKWFALREKSQIERNVVSFLNSCTSLLQGAKKPAGLQLTASYS